MTLKRDSTVRGSRLNDANGELCADLRLMPITSASYLSNLVRFMRMSMEANRVAKRIFNNTYFYKAPYRRVNVLDVGCSNGVAAQLHASVAFQRPGRAYLNYIGLDLDEKSLCQAVADTPNRFVCLHPLFVKCDIAEAWPIPNEWADVVWYCEALEHVPEARAEFTLAEAYRCSKTDGSMLLATPAPLGSTLASAESHDHEFTREETNGMLNRTGWNILDMWGIHRDWSKHPQDEAGKFYSKVFNRSSGAFAATVAQILYPEVCDDLMWYCKKAL